MRTSIKAIIAASALAATSVAAVQPAQARDHTGVAIAAGIIGLGVGAAIASDHSRYERTDYYRSYPQPYYYGTPYAYDYNYGYDYGRPDYRGDRWRDDRRHGDYDRGGRDYRDHDDHWHR